MLKQFFCVCGGGTAEKLPPQYREVEYLLGGGNQYIRTDFLLEETDNVEMTFMFNWIVDVQHDGMFFSRGYMGDGTFFGIGITDLEELVIYEGDTYTWLRDVYLTRDVKHVFKKVGLNIYLDDVLIATLAGGWSTTEGPCNLFAGFRSSDEPAGRCSIMGRIYSFKVTAVNGHVKADLVPCYDTSYTRTNGMYNLVNKTLYSASYFEQNMYTRGFALGPSKLKNSEKKRYSQVEYIEGDHTCRVTTGVRVQWGENENRWLGIVQAGEGHVSLGVTWGGTESPLFLNLQRLAESPYRCGLWRSGAETLYGGYMWADDETQYEFYSNSTHHVLNLNGGYYLDAISTNILSTFLGTNSNQICLFSDWRDLEVFQLHQFFTFRIETGNSADGYLFDVDFIPVVKKDTGEAGFYDCVSKTFFGNIKEGGELIPGPEVQ